jgi:predicted AlkP superfamily phosphohydrolase/phosphomutase
MVVALDAADPALVRALAARGEMPAMARLLREGAAVETLAPMGVFVGANWPTLFTATGPDRHHFLCWEEIRGGTYDHVETDPNWIRGTPLWHRLSNAGKRVAVVDVPHTMAEPVNGVMLVEWGCHDRHLGTKSWPPELAGELVDRHGEHYGSMPFRRGQFAPCDYRHRDGAERTPDETAALFEDICRGIENKRRVSLDLLDRGGWDLFFTVSGESHCVGHQLWHLHEREHPRHDAQLAARIGGDPMHQVYRRLDRLVGQHLERLGPDDTAYVVMAHGMAAHHDGTHLLDQVLNRLEWGIDNPRGFGLGTRAAAEAARLVPPALRTRAFGRAAPLLRRHATTPGLDPVPPREERRWFLTPNNTVVGAVRLNLAGREPAGRIQPEDRRAVLDWLARRLGELVNLDTGGPVVRRCVVTDDVYRRSYGDAFGDLYVEWERDAPIERVWSPATGTVAVPYEHWRQGDHVREGLTLAVGPGIRPGARRSVHSVPDLGATIAAAAGAALPDADGRPIDSILPAGVAPRRLERVLGPRADRRVPPWARRSASTAVDPAPQSPPPAPDLSPLEGRVAALERGAEVGAMSAWLRNADVPEDLLVSVVMATRDRCDLLAGAIASVKAQSYARWELLVVDDASTDRTAELLAREEDPRVRSIRATGDGECAARNLGLDAAHGDVIVYLDDDNRFDPDWLKAVALTFTTLPDTEVAYGARVCDDFGRVHDEPSNGRPWMQFAAWDPVALEDFNIADTNVLAHRPSSERFDEELSFYGDWDLLLRLTRNRAKPPTEIPAIAAYYRTDVEGRMTATVPREEIERAYRRILDKREVAR